MAATAPSMIYVALVAVALTVGLGGMESCSQTREAEFPTPYLASSTGPRTVRSNK
jgi:hypothetical protein